METDIFANSFFKSCNASLTVVCEWNKKVKKCTRRSTSLHRRHLEVRGYVGRRRRRRRRRHCSFFHPQGSIEGGRGERAKGPFSGGQRAQWKRGGKRNRPTGKWEKFRAEGRGDSSCASLCKTTQGFPLGGMPTLNSGRDSNCTNTLGACLFLAVNKRPPCF